MSKPDQFPDRPDVSAINEAATRELIKGSIDMCGDIVTFVHGGLVAFLEKDRELNARLERDEVSEGEELDYYVLDDFLAVPGAADNFQRSLALKFSNNIGDIRGGSNQLHAYVPVAEDFDINFDEVPRTGTVYIEHENIHGDYTRYAIGETGFSPYSALRDGQEVTEADLIFELDDQRRVDSGLPALAKIFENLVNMDIVPQRRVIVGQNGVINL